MMNCGRCGGSRGTVNHYRNDLFEGWFCPQCVNTLINVALMTMVEEELPLAREKHDRQHVHAAGCDHDRPEYRDA